MCGMALIAFRSLEDGTVAHAAKGIVDSARRHAPHLIAATEDSDALPACHIYALDVAHIVENHDNFWPTLDAAIGKVFIPGKNLLVIDCSWEGEDFIPEHFVRLHSALTARMIPLDTVALITMCRNLPTFYDE